MATQPAKKNGCLANLLAGAAVLGLLAWGINSCVNSSLEKDRQRAEASKEQERREESRRESLTPAQRKAEDDARREAAWKQAAEAQAGKRGVQAAVHAETVVRENLKHPDDAEFSAQDTQANAAGNVFQVTGKVQAKNDFGGSLTYRYTVFLLHERDGWSAISCYLDGNRVYHDAAAEKRAGVKN